MSLDALNKMAGGDLGGSKRASNGNGMGIGGDGDSSDNNTTSDNFHQPYSQDG